MRNVSMRHGGRVPLAVGARTTSCLGDATIRFDKVAVYAPDGARLVLNLNLELRKGRSVIIMGPNGSGKSSLLRVLAGLWPLQGGNIMLPPQREVFYLSQRPYLVAGSLRDQLLYPRPPAAVWAAAAPEERAAFSRLPGPGACRDLDAAEEEARLEACLCAVELGYLLERGRGWEQVRPWKGTLSGGEQQRLAMARLLFHGPTYAILDECTSAVSADGEVALYRACVEAGIVLLSIGHRPAVKAFHASVLHFQPGVGDVWHLEELSSMAGDSGGGAVFASGTDGGGSGSDAGGDSNAGVEE